MKKVNLFNLLLALPLLHFAQVPELVVPIGHTKSVMSAIFSPPCPKGEICPLGNTEYVLTSSIDGTAILWDARIGKKIHQLKGHENGVFSTAFSPDGSQLLIVKDSTVISWHTLSGQKAGSFTGHSGWITKMIFSPDGAYLLTASRDSTAVLWDSRSGARIRTLRGHAGEVTCAAFSPDGSLLLTGSRDSTAVLWETHSGRQIRFFEGQGQVEDVAFSPKGGQLFIQEKTYEPFGTVITIWDVVTNKKVNTFQELSKEKGVLNFKTVFTPSCSSCPFGEGNYLLMGEQRVVTTEPANYLLLWDIQSGEQKQVFIGQEGNVWALSFSGDGTRLLVSHQNRATSWDASSQKPIISYQSHAQNIKGLSFSSDGERLLATGTSAAFLWGLSDGKQQHTFKGHKKALTQAVLSPDGEYALTNGLKDSTALLWDARSGQMVRKISGDFNEVWSVAFGPDCRPCPPEHTWPILLSTFSKDTPGPLGMGRSNITIWDNPSEQLQHALPSPGTGMAGKGVAFFTPDGKYFSSSNLFITPGRNVFTEGITVTVWESASGKQVQTFRAPAAFFPFAAFSPDGQHLITNSDNRDTLATIWNPYSGELLQAFHPREKDSYPQARAVAFSPGCTTSQDCPYGEGRYVLISENNKLTLWDTHSGQPVKDFEGHNNTVTSALFSPSCPKGNSCLFGNGKFIATGSLDNTIKLWDTQSGKEVATLISVDSSDWVVTTPSGLFDASPGAMRLMHYIVIYEGLWESIELFQLKERYYEPGLLQKLLGYSDEPLRSVEGFDTIALYPTVRLELDTPSHRLQIKLRPRNGGIGPASVFINGKEVIPDANPLKGFDRIRDTSFSIDLTAFSRFFLKDSLNTISVRAYNQAGWLKSPAYTVAYRPNFAGSKGTADNTSSPLSFQAPPTPALYAIIVGTADYAGKALDLKYPGKDAQAMAKAIQQAGKQLFGDSLHIRLFITDTTDTTDANSHPTKANIKAAFEYFERQAKAEDILLTYFSGHGTTYGDADKTQFYYLTQEVSSDKLSDDEVRHNRTISTDELTKWINSIPAQKQVMILDACSSGKVVETLSTATKTLNSSQILALDRMKDRTGMYVLAGSAADKVSYEASQYGQGLLTYSLLEGMGRRKLRDGKYVDVVQLFEYARDKVPELAKNIGGIQTPTMLTPSGGSIDIGIVNEQVQIPIALPKPVFVRNNFQEEMAFNDVLGLTDILENHFQQITAKGARAELIYIDVRQFQNAYSIKGRYEVNGEIVALKARLFRENQPLGDIQVQGAKGQLEALVEEVLRQAFGILQKE